MLEAGHDLIFSTDERKTEDFCAQQSHFFLFKIKENFISGEYDHENLIGGLV